MMDPTTMAIPVTIVLAAAEAIIEAAVVTTVIAAWNLMRIVWSMTVVGKRVVMAMMMGVRRVTVWGPMM